MIAQSLLPEFDHEFATLRTALERVPEDRADWKPHEKSYSFAQLAGHLAELPTWVGATLNQDVLDFAEMDYTPYVMTTREELLETLDRNVAEAREVLANTSDETMMSDWTMRTGDQVHFTMPKVAVFRSFILSHMIHHRAQLGVYLRLSDVPVPQSYGPTADEGGM